MPYSSSLSGSTKPKVESTQADGRSFEEIRQDCLRRGILFEDPDFPAKDDSIFYSQSVPINFEWKRPKVSFFCHLWTTVVERQYSVIKTYEWPEAMF